MKLKYLVFLLFLSVDSFGLEAINQNLLDHAKQYPSNHLVLSEIVEYLSQKTKNEEELAEILFYWVSQNIDYDLEKLADKNRTKTYESILTSRRGVCQDYAELYKELCDLAKIECFVVSGFAKGSRYSKGDIYTESNHAWNIVKINNAYKFVDATWGSGGVDVAKNIYVREIDIKYILTDADEFSANHLAEYPMWQLRENPISLESFNRYDTYEEMMPKAEIGYNYQDSIKRYLALSVEDRKIKKRKSIYHFNPNLENLTLLIYAYGKKAYRLSKEPFAKELIEKSNRYYRIARSYCKIGVHESEEIFEKALWINRGITYNNYRMATEKRKAGK